MRKISQKPLIWDNHCCVPLRIDGSFLPQLERYRAAGAIVASLNVGYANISWKDHLEVLSFIRHWVTHRSDSYRLVASVDEIDQCRNDGKLGVVFDVEGMCPVQENPWLVQTFYELGVRWMLIAYNKNNEAGGGCMDDDCGLTAIGRAIIDEMERVGMVLCLSHAGERTVLDALEYVRNPPIFSHSNPRGEFDHVRNISDRVMKECANKGGVIGLSGIGPFLGAIDDLVERLLDQLRYTIDLVGASHVGLGLDYVFDTAELEHHVRSNPSQFPSGISEGLAMIPPEAFGEIAEGLARMKLSESDIRGVMGNNWLRVAAQVWK